MKKVKIMLVAITVLAATAGVLAFKAKQPVKFCTVEPVIIAGVTTCSVDNAPLACDPAQTIERQKPTTDAQVPFKCYATTALNANCPANCITLQRLTNE